MNFEEIQNLIQSIGNLNIIYFGSCESNFGVEENIGVDDEKCFIYVFNVGFIGYGKMQLLIYVVLQDVEKDYGFVIINLKGDLIDEFFFKLFENRRDDVVYINLARDLVILINVFEFYIIEEMLEVQ